MHQIASIGGRFALIRIEWMLHRCNIHSVSSEQFDRRQSTWIDARSIEIDVSRSWSIPNVELRRFHVELCRFITEHVFDVNRRKSTIDDNRIDQNRPNVEQASIRVDSCRFVSISRRPKHPEVARGMLHLCNFRSMSIDANRHWIDAIRCLF
jgi:hypothetical protein